MGRAAAQGGQQARGEQEVRGNIIMINRFLVAAAIASSLGYLSTLSCPKTLYNTKEKGQEMAKMCVRACMSNLLAH